MSVYNNEFSYNTGMNGTTGLTGFWAEKQMQEEQLVDSEVVISGVSGRFGGNVEGAELLAQELFAGEKRIGSGLFAKSGLWWNEKLPVELLKNEKLQTIAEVVSEVSL